MFLRSLVTPSGLVVLAALAVDYGLKSGIDARSFAFIQRTGARNHYSSSTAVVEPSDNVLLSRTRIQDIPRGGSVPGTETSGDKKDNDDDDAAEAEVLYLPGLLEIHLITTDQVSFIIEIDDCLVEFNLHIEMPVLIIISRLSFLLLHPYSVNFNINTHATPLWDHFQRK